MDFKLPWFIIITTLLILTGCSSGKKLSQCEDLSKNLRPQCYTNAAIDNKDSDLCNNADDLKNECLKRVAVNTRSERAPYRLTNTKRCCR